MAQRQDLKPGKWTGLIFAIQFLTIVPISTRHRFNAAAALPFFPVCGLLMGALVMAADTAFGMLWPRPVVAILDVVLLAFLSGALHLDGLADTADGLYGRREPQKALRIMKDSRIGAMGMIAVASCLLVKWAALTHLTTQPKLWLLLVPALARATALIGTKALPYGRPEDGTGHAFFTAPLKFKDFWGLGILVALTSMGGWQALGVFLVLAVLVLGILSWYRRKIGCITGDMLGAMIEISEAGLFLTAAAHWGG